MIINNMTPHPIIILNEENKVIARFESVGQIRLSAKTVADELIIHHEPCRGGIDDHEHSIYCGCPGWDGWKIAVPTSRTVFGDPQGLPEFVAGTWYIVSQIVKSALPGRTDLLVPAEVVRDASGNIIGCRSLGR
jgi:hypothetical protein